MDIKQSLFSKKMIKYLDWMIKQIKWKKAIITGKSIGLSNKYENTNENDQSLYPMLCM